MNGFRHGVPAETVDEDLALVLYRLMTVVVSILWVRVCVLRVVVAAVFVIVVEAGFGFMFWESNMEKEGPLKVIITITVTIGAIAIVSTAYFLWRRMGMTHKRGNTKYKSGENLLFDYLNDVKFHELPIFNLEEVATATNNFHVANMLGRGGFGPVYRIPELVTVVFEPGLPCYTL
ncbi:g-type lectin s-receptor-like serine/threonine-protein kinase sd1-13, partial [Quercus suber]